MNTGAVYSLLIVLSMIFSQAAIAGVPVHGSNERRPDMNGHIVTLSTHHLVHPERAVSLLDNDARTFKVISVLERHIHDKELLEKVRHKLPSMSEKRLKLMESLSDRMTDNGRGPESSIAFLLIATLIIFS